MMKCKQCENEAFIVKGEPIKEGMDAYWKQIFVCKNPNCINYNKVIGEKYVNIFNEKDTKEKQF